MPPKIIAAFLPSLSERTPPGMAEASALSNYSFVVSSLQRLVRRDEP